MSLAGKISEAIGESAPSLETTATCFRAAQFYAHVAHNLTRGETFFEDHEFFGELYGVYEKAYDDVVERMIGLGMAPNLTSITIDAANRLKNAPGPDTEMFFIHLVKLEAELREAISQAVPSASDGTQDLLQQLAGESEKRSYKLGQRVQHDVKVPGA